MKPNSWTSFFVLLFLSAAMVLSIMWITFESNHSKNLETASHYKQQMIQASDNRTGPWEYVNSSGETFKTQDCTKTDDFWSGVRCAETEDGKVVFRYQPAKSGQIYHPKMTVDGKELELNCVKLGDSFIEQHNHCGV